MTFFIARRTGRMCPAHKKGENMASRQSIEFDFEQAKRQADELDSIAYNLKNLSNNKLNQSMQNLSQSWKGENATAYLKKGGILAKDILDSSSQLSDIANDIRTIARNTYETEMEAIRIAEEREYNRNS